MSDTSTARASIERLLHEAALELGTRVRRELDAVLQAAEAQRLDALESARQEMARQIELAQQRAAADVAAVRAAADREIEEALARAERAEQAIVRLQGDVDDVNARWQETQAALAAMAAEVASSTLVPAGAALSGASLTPPPAPPDVPPGETAAAPDTGAAEVSLARLVLLTRELQQARTLGEVLEGLLRAARTVVDRVALYIVRGDCLQEWTALGPSGPAEVSRRLWPAESPLWFEDDRGTFPVRVGGVVVAVLSIEAAPADPQAHPTWVSAIDLLTRHASLVLEALTLRRGARLDRRGDVYPPAEGLTALEDHA